MRHVRRRRLPRHVRRRRLPDPTVAFCTGATLTLGWRHHLEAGGDVVLAPVMAMSTLAYLLLWLQPLLPSPGRSAPLDEVIGRLPQR